VKEFSRIFSRPGVLAALPEKGDHSLWSRTRALPIMVSAGFR
jgi:hypothetical protein